MIGFGVSSSVPEAPVTPEIGTALLEHLRRVEALWAPYLVEPETAPGNLDAIAREGLVNNAEKWGRLPNVGLEYTTVVGDVSPAANICRVELLPDFRAFPEVPPEDEAFHMVDSLGRQVAYLSFAACGADWVSAAAHEIGEARIDADCSNSFPRGDGTRWAAEVADSLEGTDYTEPGGAIRVANVAGPRYFGITDEGPLDIAGAVYEPWQEPPGAYHTVIAADGTETQIYGEQVPPEKRAELDRRGARSRKARRK
jgi:hypothetical protein